MNNNHQQLTTTTTNNHPKTYEEFRNHCLSLSYEELSELLAKTELDIIVISNQLDNPVTANSQEWLFKANSAKRFKTWEASYVRYRLSLLTMQEHRFVLTAHKLLDSDTLTTIKEAANIA